MSAVMGSLYISPKSAINIVGESQENFLVVENE